MKSTSGWQRSTTHLIVRASGSLARRLAVSAIIAVSIAACSSSKLGREQTASASPNLITAEELSKVSAQNALEAVQKLRPAMLRRSTISSANAQSRGEIIIYIDNSRYGSVDNLRSIPTSSIAMVRYFSASESQLKWGSGHPGGVIEVVTKR